MVVGAEATHLRPLMSISDLMNVGARQAVVLSLLCFCFRPFHGRGRGCGGCWSSRDLRGCDGCCARLGGDPPPTVVPALTSAM